MSAVRIGSLAINAYFAVVAAAAAVHYARPKKSCAPTFMAVNLALLSAFIGFGVLLAAFFPGDLAAAAALVRK